MHASSLKRITRAGIAMVISMAALAPAAQAHPDQSQSWRWMAHLNGFGADRAALARHPLASNGPAVMSGRDGGPKVETVRIPAPSARSDESGFDWTAAAVGAGVGGLFMLAGGVSARRRHAVA